LRFFLREWPQLRKRRAERDHGKLLRVPEISRFLGIVIAILYREHDPPHFHATYGEYGITVGILDGVVSGTFPKRALRHVLEWHELHRAELLEDWNLARQHERLKPIPPLE